MMASFDKWKVMMQGSPDDLGHPQNWLPTASRRCRAAARADAGPVSWDFLGTPGILRMDIETLPWKASLFGTLTENVLLEFSFGHALALDVSKLFQFQKSNQKKCPSFKLQTSELATGLLRKLFSLRNKRILPFFCAGDWKIQQCWLTLLVCEDVCR